MQLPVHYRGLMASIFQKLLKKQPRPASRQVARGQSFLELAIVLPVILIMLLGMVEVVVFIGRYLDVLDLTREAARFASVRDPFTVSTGTANCSDTNYYNFYYNTACVLSPPAGSASCTDSNYCNGLNPYVYINPATDDVIISVYTVQIDSDVSAVHPVSGVWALSDHDADTAHNGNWTKDCEGNVVRSVPYYTQARVQSQMEAAESLPNRGYVAVEVFYCHAQVLGIPIISDFIDNPLQIHAYTIMSLPAAQPTPSPIP